MIDASQGFLKDGNKNRFRERDIHLIHTTFTHQTEIPDYSRLVPLAEIADPKNDYNLNLPRYIDSSEPEDRQDLHAHLHGGIPLRDLDGDPTAHPPVPGLSRYWKSFPQLRKTLFQPHTTPGYATPTVQPDELKPTILSHPEFLQFRTHSHQLFQHWEKQIRPLMAAFSQDSSPKPFIHQLSTSLLAAYQASTLLDPYDLYQHLMDYWHTTIQDDAWQITADGWIAQPTILYTESRGKRRKSGWECDLIPKPLIIQRYYPAKQQEIDTLQAELETFTSQLTDLEEEHSAEDAAFSSLDKINQANVKTLLAELKNDPSSAAEIAILKQWQKITKKITNLRKTIRQAEATLDQLVFDHYPTLTTEEIQSLVIDDKWLATLHTHLDTELDRLSQTLTTRLHQLTNRYAHPLPEILARIDALTTRVNHHLQQMGAL